MLQSILRRVISSPVFVAPRKVPIARVRGTNTQRSQQQCHGAADFVYKSRGLGKLLLHISGVLVSVSPCERRSGYYRFVDLALILLQLVLQLASKMHVRHLVRYGISHGAGQQHSRRRNPEGCLFYGVVEEPVRQYDAGFLLNVRGSHGVIFGVLYAVAGRHGVLSELGCMGKRPSQYQSGGSHRGAYAGLPHQAGHLIRSLLIHIVEYLAAEVGNGLRLPLLGSAGYSIDRIQQASYGTGCHIGCINGVIAHIICLQLITKVSASCFIHTGYGVLIPHIRHITQF